MGSSSPYMPSNAPLACDWPLLLAEIYHSTPARDHVPRRVLAAAHVLQHGDDLAKERVVVGQSIVNAYRSTTAAETDVNPAIHALRPRLLAALDPPRRDSGGFVRHDCAEVLREETDPRRPRENTCWTRQREGQPVVADVNINGVTYGISSLPVHDGSYNT